MNQDFDVLCYLDKITEDELKSAKYLIEQEINELGNLNNFSHTKGSIQSKIIRYSTEKNLQSNYFNDKYFIDNILCDNNNIQDQISIKKLYNQGLSKIGNTYEHLKIYYDNLELLKEYGEDLWIKYLDILKNDHKSLQIYDKYLSKSIQDININRKNQQIEFATSKLDPLLRELEQIHKENINLMLLLKSIDFK
ncbi:uncharacterized protein CMU_010100 [Cryptosporidium muris RN66]|uniref:Uncharacterized protein n=1 Tax=Cryptosporidium muris (strain RN66) TaxID=441375 RepID=B6AE77_CRYMR|nr:uncharacterized protein CMU_010100 [Cryptosporidium muris RN66]EEA06518.1 hypothetical protein, conserved [Cryptosporidium muris RN66]|eukprot:XP_002140867.1 hypothetical protein [Cryptosporidium muris RN66]